MGYSADDRDTYQSGTSLTVLVVGAEGSPWSIIIMGTGFYADKASHDTAEWLFPAMDPADGGP